MPDGTLVDLHDLTSMVSCGRTACSEADLDALSEERPWGRNNPRWQLYGYGALLTPSAAGAPSVYAIVWLADDPSGTVGRLSLMAHAYGPRGTRRVIEATVLLTDHRVEMLSWREIR